MVYNILTSLNTKTLRNLMTITTLGNLYIVATPIGNPDDITLRAVNTLKAVDGVICEEYRDGSTLLKALEIAKTELILYNEHNAAAQTPIIIEKLISGKNLALISDCGTPVFADPGYLLVEQAAIYQIRVIPLPGPSSLTTTLSILDFKLDEFYFAGFLPRETQQRSERLQKLKALKVPIVLMDTPYRLVKLLDEVISAFGKARLATLACDLTLPSEKIYRGTLSEIRTSLEKQKAEFMLVIHREG